jgi:hypothetical protein
MSYYTFGMYPVIWPREDRRLYLVRCTMGVPTQAEIEVRAAVRGWGVRGWRTHGAAAGGGGPQGALGSLSHPARTA